MSSSRRSFFLGFLLAMISVGLFVAVPVFAQDMKAFAEAAGLSTGASLEVMITRLIRTAISFVGIILVIMLLYGGLLWMTAKGNPKQLEKAKGVLTQAIIGVVIILSAFTIVQFILNKLVDATTGEITTCDDPAECPDPTNYPPPPSVYVFQLLEVNTEQCSTAAIQNLQVQLNFTAKPDVQTLNDGIVVQKENGSPVDGTFSVKGSSAVFTPDAFCPPPNTSLHCFDANTKYEMVIDASVVESTSGKSLSCSAGGICGKVPFYAGNIVDVTGPSTSMTLPGNGDSVEVSTIAQLQADTLDDIGVSSVDFFAVTGDEPVFSAGLSSSVEEQLMGGESNAFFTDPNLEWDTVGYVTNKSYPIWAVASDCAGNTATASKINVMVRAAHCFNNRQDTDFGETGEDCGGDPKSEDYCGKCIADPCEGNSECASGFCENGVCVSKTRIDFVSPGDGAIGNLVTIGGKGFGDAGVITFEGKEAREALEVSAYQCLGNVKWSDKQIVVQVPSNAKDGPIIVTTSEGGKDRTDDEFGPLSADFDVNAITRPGLCSATPENGPIGSGVNFAGLGFGSTIGSAGMYFKNFLSPVLTMVVEGIQLDAVVPNMTAGSVSTQLFTGDYQCINAEKATIGKTCLQDQDCGAGNTCASSWCSETLAYCKTDADCGTAGGQCVSVRVGSNKLNFKVEDVAGPTAEPVISYVETGWKACEGGSSQNNACSQDTDCNGGLCKPKQNWGPVGQYVTIYGTNFGSSVGLVYFKTGLAQDILADTNFPEQCGGFWSDTSITVKVPSVAGRLGAYQLSVKQGTKESNNVEFQVVSGQPGPSICSLDPVSGPVGSKVDIIGENFGSQHAIVKFFDQQTAGYTIWSDKLITKAIVPSLAKTGPVSIQDNGGKISNSQNFIVESCLEDFVCQAGYSCCGDGSCRLVCDAPPKKSHFAYRVSTGIIPENPAVVVACGADVKSPSPSSQWPDSKIVCLNAEVAAEFTKKMDSTTVVNNVLVDLCVDADLANCKNWSAVDGNITTLAQSFKWNPSKMFEPNSLYRVTVRGGSSGVLADAGEGGAPMLNDFIWNFSTGDVDNICEIGDVVVKPSEYTATEQDELVAYGVSLAAKGKQCIWLNPNPYSYVWSSNVPQLAEVQAPISGAGKISADVKAKEETEPGTPAKIKAIVTSALGLPSDTADLTIDFSNPTVEAYFPICGTACVNVKPWFRFKSDIKASTLLNTQAVELYECKNALCADSDLIGSNLVTGVVCTLSTTKQDVCEKGKPVYVKFGSNLKANTSYRVILDGTLIQSPSLVALKDSGTNYGSEQNKYFVDDFSWKFKTKNSDISCGIDSLAVAPQTKILKTIGDRQSYLATGYGAPDDCDASGQALQDTQVTWKAWSAKDDAANIANGGTDNDVAVMLGSPAGAISLVNQLPAYCTSVCLNAGTVVKNTDAICGDGIVNGTGKSKSEECDDNNAVSGDGCSSACLLEGSNACTTAAQTGCCGDKQVTGAEQCDDGNTSSGDGCSSQCLNEGSSSIKSICGDGIQDYFAQTGGEDCDDGNKKSGDGCSANCLFEGSIPTGTFSAICGNGQKELGEDCDDGNSLSGDGCSSICLHEGSSLSYSPSSLCGNNIKQTGEDCDDGNSISGDGCSSKCLFEGSSISYSTPSFCGDTNQGIGEECEGTVSAKNPKDITGYGVAQISVNAPKEIGDQGGTAYSVITATAVGTAKDVVGTASLGIECSCQTDQACGSSSTKGCGTGSCCFSRPQLGTVLPASGSGPGSQGYCRNTAVSVAFNQKMNPKTFEAPVGAPVGKEVGNLRLHLVKKDGKNVTSNPQLCPANYKKLTSSDQPSKNLFVRVWNWLRSLFTQNVVAATNDCYVNLTYTSIDTAGGQKIILNYPDLLEANAEYQIEIVGDSNGTDGIDEGVLSENKVGLCLSPSGSNCAPLFSQTFSVGTEICELEAVDVVDHGKVSKQPYESASPNFFSKNNEEHQFESTPLTYREGTGTYETIQPINAYKWEWSWDSSIVDSEANNVVSKKSNTSNQANFASVGTNGSEHVVATATISVDTIHTHSTKGDAVSGSTEVTAFVCERPWPQAPAKFPYIEETAKTNFGFFYCMDRGGEETTDDLPAIATPVDVTSVSNPNLLQELLFKIEGTSDAIGVRVFKNKEYLSPEAWFKAQEFTGGYQAIKMDGYEGILAGNTVYVAAANQSSSILFSNIYVVSFNPNAGADAKEIFQQIVKNWKFNANTTVVSNIGLCKIHNAFVNTLDGDFIGCSWDGDCIDILQDDGQCSVSKFQPTAGNLCPLDETKVPHCENAKIKIQRDLKRLTDVNANVDKLDLFGSNNKHCSVTKNISCSSDPQCPGKEKCVEGFPTLQQGTFVPSISVSKWDSWYAQFSNELGSAIPVDPLNVFWKSCDVGEGYDPATCFNGSAGTFECPDKSHVYGYRSVGGEDYVLYTQLEYGGAKWNDKIDKQTNDHAKIIAEYEKGSPVSGSLPAGFTKTAEFCVDSKVWGVSQICGDGVLGDGEECEPGQTSKIDVAAQCGATGKDPGSYPITCKPNCTWQNLTEAVAAGSVCVPVSCGNGVLETGETCDDGALNGTYGHCDTNCSFANAVLCGDGYLSGNEQCDCGTVENNGTLKATSGTWANTHVICSVANGQYRAAGSCSYDCKEAGPSCGDKEINGAEQCDGGIETDNTGCGSSKICIGGTQAGKACSPGSSCPGGTCSDFVYPLAKVRTCNDNSCNWNAWTSCVGGDQYCGNGTVEGTEQCDDGNLSDNDGCTNTCVKNVCGDDFVWSGVEACDNGNENVLPGTANPCSAPYGGTCNYCDTSCQYKTTSGSYCGDEKISGTEYCDGNVIPKSCFKTGTSGEKNQVFKSCKEDSQCTSSVSGSFCAKVGVCNGGPSNGDPCTASSQCGTGSCSLPICSNDCSGACPFSFQETNLLVQSELQGSQPQPAINLFSYLNKEKETPDNALLNLPACLVGTKITANVDNAKVQVPNVDIVFITDVSGTMNQTPSGGSSTAPNRKTDIAAASLSQAIDELFDSYPTTGGKLRIGLVSFAGPVKKDSELLDNTGANKQLLKNIVNNYPNNIINGTETGSALKMAKEMLAPVPSNHIKIVVLLTDGEVFTSTGGLRCNGHTTATPPYTQLTGNFVTEKGSTFFAGERWCVAEARYDVIQKNPLDFSFFYSAMITTKDSYIAYGEHMSSMKCAGASMSSKDDCNENADQVGTYAYHASTKEGIEFMYDQIIKSILSSTTTVSASKGSSVQSATTLTPVGNNIQLNIPSNFECKSTPFTMPLRTSFYGTGTMKFDNFKFTYCPAP